MTVSGMIREYFRSSANGSITAMCRGPITGMIQALGRRCATLRHGPRQSTASSTKLKWKAYAERLGSMAGWYRTEGGHVNPLGYARPGSRCAAGRRHHPHQFKGHQRWRKWQVAGANRSRCGAGRQGDLFDRTCAGRGLAKVDQTFKIMKVFVRGDPGL